jgi:death-on-curing protein
MEYLTLDDILNIRNQVSAAANDRFEIMSTNALMSALAAPRRSAFGAEAFPSLAEKAGALVYSLIQNHPFWDGNKRIATAALRLFLERNNARLTTDPGLSRDEGDRRLKGFTIAIASGRLRDQALVDWLKDRIEELGSRSNNVE